VAALKRDRKRPHILIYVGASVLIVAVVTIFAYLYVFVPLKETVQISNRLVEGLVNRNFTQVLEATRGCAECARRLEKRWMDLTAELGSIRAWKFQRVVVATEAGSRQNSAISKAGWWYEVEYEMVFDKGQREVVILMGRENGSSHPVDMHVRHVSTIP